MKYLLITFSVIFSSQISALSIVTDFTARNQLESLSLWNEAHSNTSLTSNADGEISINVTSNSFGVATQLDSANSLQNGYNDLYSIDVILDDLSIEMKSSAESITAGFNLFFYNDSFEPFFNPLYGQAWFIYETEISTSWTTYEFDFDVPAGASYFRFDLMTQKEGGQVNGTFTTDFRNLTVVPEPSTYALILGVLVLGFVAYRRK
jgi:hypothetical protein